MKLVVVALMMMTGLTAFAGFSAFQGTASLGLYNSIKCSTGVTCIKQGDKLNVTVSPITQSVIAATAITLTPASCGQVYFNTTGTSIVLPLASSAIGCKITFVVLNASNFDVRANALDQILIATSGVGRAARSSVLGTTITVQSVASNKYAVIAQQGVWADTP